MGLTLMKAAKIYSSIWVEQMDGFKTLKKAKVEFEQGETASPCAKNVIPK